MSFELSDSINASDWHVSLSSKSASVFWATDMHSAARRTNSKAWPMLTCITFSATSLPWACCSRAAADAGAGDTKDLRLQDNYESPVIVEVGGKVKPSVKN
jgi:hypothetical protein